MPKDAPAKRGRPSLGQRLLGLERKDMNQYAEQPKNPNLANPILPPIQHSGMLGGGPAHGSITTDKQQTQHSISARTGELLDSSRHITVKIIS